METDLFTVDRALRLVTFHKPACPAFTSAFRRYDPFGCRTESVRLATGRSSPCRTPPVAVRMTYGPPGGQGLQWRRNYSPPTWSSTLGPRYSLTAMSREGHVVRAFPRDSRSPSTTNVVKPGSRPVQVDGAPSQDGAPFSSLDFTSSQIESPAPGQMSVGLRRVWFWPGQAIKPSIGTLRSR